MLNCSGDSRGLRTAISVITNAVRNVPMAENIQTLRSKIKSFMIRFRSIATLDYNS